MNMKEKVMMVPRIQAHGRQVVLIIIIMKNKWVPLRVQAYEGQI